MLHASACMQVYLAYVNHKVVALDDKNSTHKKARDLFLDKARREMRLGKWVYVSWCGECGSCGMSFAWTGWIVCMLNQAPLAQPCIPSSG